ncbi:MAG: FmdB family zinc ribbon protein [Akkermansiaceae bacterium]
MPNYDYQCKECGHTFEVFQRMSDPKLEDCPQEDCAGKIRRLLGTGSGVIFKGSGFYQTDYRSDSYKKGQTKETGASKKGDSSGPSK